MALIQVIVIASLLQYLTAVPVPNHEVKLHEDTGLDTVELITKYGYPVELHGLVTEDGYILTMQRIPHGKTNSKATKQPVLVMHGLMSSAADFVNIGDKSLAFLLADAGYDVWLGNARGTTWSRNHTTLDPDEKDFWIFSWNEIGVYDLTAKIDYILETTGEEKVQYIGHSQGTTSFYAMASQRTEYNDKISLMVSLAPVAYMSHLLSPIFLVASQFHADLEWLFDELGIFEFLPHFEDASLLQAMCDDGHPYQDVCASAIFLIAGYNLDQLNPSLFPVIMTNAPAGASTRQLLHYAQGIKSGYFRLYDFGTEQNLIAYGQEVPPDYDITQITAPVSLFYSANDWCAAEVDVEQLASELGNLVHSYKVEDPRFNHIDFLWAKDVVPLLYSKVIDVMDQY